MTATMALCACLEPDVSMAIEEPRYQTLSEAGEFSLRRYSPHIVAETTIEGSFDHASSAGFRRLAGYIFGDNRAPAGGSDKIAMTAPVLVADASPVAVTAVAAPGAQRQQWSISFVMPSQYTMSTLPKPDDTAVQIREVPAQTLAVMRFSGWVYAAKIAENTAALRAWMSRQHLVATGTPQVARYDPPWTLPFLRRNEILIPCR